jgi:hypothetical protein
MNINVLGIDIAKNVFELHIVDEKGVQKKRLKPRKVGGTYCSTTSLFDRN